MLACMDASGSISVASSLKRELFFLPQLFSQKNGIVRAVIFLLSVEINQVGAA
jgi:hypothetical protein